MVLNFQQSSFHFMELLFKRALYFAIIVSTDNSWQNLSPSCLTIQFLVIRDLSSET